MSTGGWLHSEQKKKGLEILREIGISDAVKVGISTAGNIKYTNSEKGFIIIHTHIIDGKYGVFCERSKTSKLGMGFLYEAEIVSMAEHIPLSRVTRITFNSIRQLLCCLVFFLSYRQALPSSISMRYEAP